jgi:hypothetical protein
MQSIEVIRINFPYLLIVGVSTFKTGSAMNLTVSRTGIHLSYRSLALFLYILAIMFLLIPLQDKINYS